MPPPRSRGTRCCTPSCACWSTSCRSSGLSAGSTSARSPTWKAPSSGCGACSRFRRRPRSAASPQAPREQAPATARAGADRRGAAGRQRLLALGEAAVGPELSRKPRRRLTVMFGSCRADGDQWFWSPERIEERRSSGTASRRRPCGLASRPIWRRLRANGRLAVARKDDDRASWTLRKFYPPARPTPRDPLAI